MTRVKSIKNNITIGMAIPSSAMQVDNGVGLWAEDAMESLGHVVDRAGTIDLPQINADIKTQRRGTYAARTQGSITIEDIIATPQIIDSRVWNKMKNQNQVTWDETIGEVADVELVNMDIDETREMLQEAWASVRQKVLDGDRAKSITSTNKAMILDGHNSDTSYNIRITNKAMKTIRGISRTKNAMDKLFESKI